MTLTHELADARFGKDTSKNEKFNMATWFMFLTVIANVSGISLAQPKAVMSEFEPAEVFSSASLVAACDAISDGNYAEISSLVKGGLKLDQPGKYGCTLLLWTWCQGHHHAFEALLELGASPHTTLETNVTVDIDGNRLSLTAGSSVAAIVVRFGRFQPQFVEKVVRYLRDANQRDAQGRTLLHNLMASADDQIIVRQLREDSHRDPQILKYLKDSLVSGDTGKLVQTAPFALLYNAGVDATAVDAVGLSALEQYMRWLEHSSVPPSRIDVAAHKAIGLFQRTDYFVDADRRTEFIGDLERIVERLKGSSPVLMTEGSLRSIKARDQSHYEQIRGKRDRVFPGDYGYYHFQHMFTGSLDQEVSLAIQHIPFTSRGGEVRPFSELCEIGFDVNVRGVAGITHLFVAYTAKNEEAFADLLKMKADPDLTLQQDLWPFVSEGIQSSAGGAFCPEQGDTVLLSAALNPERVPYLQMAVRYSDNNDIRDTLNRNILHRMLYHRLPQEQRLLLSQLVEAGVDGRQRVDHAGAEVVVIAHRAGDRGPERHHLGAGEGGDVDDRCRLGLRPRPRPHPRPQRSPPLSRRRRSSPSTFPPRHAGRRRHPPAHGARASCSAAGRSAHG